jgi:hypothetical protein
MPEGWWVSLCLAGLPLSAGLVVYLLWRDRVRKKREQAARPARPSRARAPSLTDLEKEYRRKG